MCKVCVFPASTQLRRLEITFTQKNFRYYAPSVPILLPPFPGSSSPSTLTSCPHPVSPLSLSNLDTKPGFFLSAPTSLPLSLSVAIAPPSRSCTQAVAYAFSSSPTKNSNRSKCRGPACSGGKPGISVGCPCYQDRTNSRTSETSVLLFPLPPLPFFPPSSPSLPVSAHPLRPNREHVHCPRFRLRFRFQFLLRC